MTRWCLQNGIVTVFTAEIEDVQFVFLVVFFCNEYLATLNSIILVVKEQQKISPIIVRDCTLRMLKPFAIYRYQIRYDNPPWDGDFLGAIWSFAHQDGASADSRVIEQRSWLNAMQLPPPRKLCLRICVFIYLSVC